MGGHVGRRRAAGQGNQGALLPEVSRQGRRAVKTGSLGSPLYCFASPSHAHGVPVSSVLWLYWEILMSYSLFMSNLEQRVLVVLILMNMVWGVTHTHE